MGWLAYQLKKISESESKVMPCQSNGKATIINRYIKVPETLKARKGKTGQWRMRDQRGVAL